MTKGSGRKRSKQQLGAEALTELKEGRATPSRNDWADRRPLRFWQPFNEWWRAELDRLGRRPNAQEINEWYEVHAHDLWKDGAPSLQETRVHAKCLRSLPLVRDYFRSYRAKKRIAGIKLPVRRRRQRAERKSGNIVPGDDQGYPAGQGEQDDEGEQGDEGEEGEMEEDEDLSGGQDGDTHAHYGMEGDPDGVYAAGMGHVDVEDLLARDPAAAAAALAHLASIRGAAGGSPVAGLPLELLHPGLPALQSYLGQSALWSSAAAAQQAAVLDAAAAAQPAELLRSFTLQQLQHVAALQHQQHQQHQQQHQLALAAFAQNLALTRASEMGLTGYSHHPVAAAVAAMLPPQHAGLLSVDEQQRQQLALEARFRAGNAAMAAAGGPGHDAGDYGRNGEGEEDEDDDAGGAVDFMEQVAQQAAALGRGKRKRGPLLGWRQDYEMELHTDAGPEFAGTDEGPTDMDGQPEPSGRAGGGGKRPGGGGGGGGASGSVQQPSGKQRRTTKTAPAAAPGAAAMKQSAAAKRQSAATPSPLAARSASVEPTSAGGRGGRELGEAKCGGPGQGQGQGVAGAEAEEERSGAPLSLVPLDEIQVPAVLGLEPVSREELTELSREELVERVLLLQAHLQLFVAQQQQLLLLHHQHVETPPPAAERRTPQQQLAARHGQHEQGHGQEQQQGLSSLRKPLQARAKHEAAPEQLPHFVKQEEQPMSMPTPARPDTSSPGKVSGSGSPVGGQRSASPPGHDSSLHQPQEPQLRPHPSTVRPQAARKDHGYPTPVQRRGADESELRNHAEVAAVSVLASLDAAAAPSPLALSTVFNDAAAAPMRPSSSRRASEGFARSSARQGSDGERGLPEPAALAEAAGA